MYLRTIHYKTLLWETRYSDNILVITYEQNLRQGGVRNIGLNYATGDFIGFWIRMIGLYQICMKYW